MKALEAWVARDENGMIYLYLAKPKKYKSKWYPNIRSDYFEIDRKCFPEVQWSDEEPKGIELSIRNEKSKIKSALSFLVSIALCVFILWVTVVKLIHCILSWVFVAITAVFEISVGGFNLSNTKIIAKIMATPMDLIADLTNFLKTITVKRENTPL